MPGRSKVRSIVVVDEAEYIESSSEELELGFEKRHFRVRIEVGVRVRVTVPGSA